jgi:antitoxin YefM
VTVVSISHARENLFPLVRQVNEDHVVIEIVARNGGNAVLMSAEGYESLQETLYLFSTRANAVHILRGLAEARDGAAQRPNWRRWLPGSACRQTGETVHRLGCPRRPRGLVHDQPQGALQDHSHETGPSGRRTDGGGSSVDLR